jgi:hypothetical protein
MLSKNDYKILINLYKYGCINELHSISVYKINELTNLSISKIRLTIKSFLNLKYIAEGLINNHSKTYYVTSDGIQKINNLISI